MSVKQKTYDRLIADHSLVSLFRDNLTDEYVTGYLQKYNNDFVYMNLIGEDGVSDGVCTVWAYDVTRIRWDGNRLFSISRLVERNETDTIARETNLSSIKSVIEATQLSYGYVGLLTERIDPEVLYVGAVKEIDHDHVLIQEFGTKSSRSSRSMLLNLEDVTCVQAGERYLEDMSYLAADQKKNG